jgi:hypothetical protein
VADTPESLKKLLYDFIRMDDSCQRQEKISECPGNAEQKYFQPVIKIPPYDKTTSGK